MPLPKINQPIHQLTLPSNGKVVHFRPFTVREEKLLLMAQESGEQKDIINTYKQLITNCCIDPVDVDKLASFDIEYFFISLRAKSVSNIAKVLIRDEDDKEQYEVEVNLDKVEVVKKPNVSNNISLTGTIGVILQYPTFESIIAQGSDKVDTLTILRNCITQIYDGEEVFDVANYTTKELDEFVLSLNTHQMEKIREFFESIPKIVAKVKYITKAGAVKEMTIEGINNFF
jgi:hypothetical protein